MALVGCRSLGTDPGECLSRYESRAVAMGTEFRCVVYAGEQVDIDELFEDAWTRLADLDSLLSDYDENSELRRLGNSACEVRIPISGDLRTLLEIGIDVSECTAGAFDVTVGPLVRLWRRAFRQVELPDPVSLEEASARVGWRRVDLNEQGLKLGARGMRLDAGGIGKGYALDQLLLLFRERGITSALVEGGGDVAVSGPPPGAGGWRVAINPLGGLGESAGLADVGALGGNAGHHAFLAHAALATSGDGFQFLEVNGRRFSHIIDPRTGWALEGRRSASVIAPTGALADALASALCVAGEAGLAEFIAPSPGIEGRLLYQPPNNDEMQACESEGWAVMMVPSVPPLAQRNL